MRDTTASANDRAKPADGDRRTCAAASAETLRQRAAALKAMAVLDTPPEQGFDALSRLAAEIFATTIACVSLIDGERIWFKSVHGLDVRTIDSRHSLCAEVANTKRLMEVGDARGDPRFAGNVLVTGALGIRYYAGAPILHRDLAVGTVCVLDPQPRAAPARSLRTLEDLALLAAVMLRARIEAFAMFSNMR